MKIFHRDINEFKQIPEVKHKTNIPEHIDKDKFFEDPDNICYFKGVKEFVQCRTCDGKARCDAYSSRLLYKGGSLPW